MRCDPLRIFLWPPVFYVSLCAYLCFRFSHATLVSSQMNWHAVGAVAEERRVCIIIVSYHTVLHRHTQKIATTRKPKTSYQRTALRSLSEFLWCLEAFSLLRLILGNQRSLVTAGRPRQNKSSARLLFTRTDKTSGPLAFK